MLYELMLIRVLVAGCRVPLHGKHVVDSQTRGHKRSQAYHIVTVVYRIEAKYILRLEQ